MKDSTFFWTAFLIAGSIVVWSTIYGAMNAQHEEEEWRRWIATCTMAAPRIAGISDRNQCVNDAIIAGAPADLK